MYRWYLFGSLILIKTDIIIIIIIFKASINQWNTLPLEAVALKPMLSSSPATIADTNTKLVLLPEEYIGLKLSGLPQSLSNSSL